jgi:hypothetical protein
LVRYDAVRPLLVLATATADPTASADKRHAAAAALTLLQKLCEQPTARLAVLHAVRGLSPHDDASALEDVEGGVHLRPAASTSTREAMLYTGGRHVQQLTAAAAKLSSSARRGSSSRGKGNGTPSPRASAAATLLPDVVQLLARVDAESNREAVSASVSHGTDVRARAMVTLLAALQPRRSTPAEQARLPATLARGERRTAGFEDTARRTLLAEQVVMHGGVPSLVEALHSAAATLDDAEEGGATADEGDEDARGVLCRAVLALRVLRRVCGLDATAAALAVKARVVPPLCALLACRHHLVHSLLATDAVVLLRHLSQVGTSLPQPLSPLGFTASNPYRYFLSYK